MFGHCRACGGVQGRRCGACRLFDPCGEFGRLFDLLSKVEPVFAFFDLLQLGGNAVVSAEDFNDDLVVVIGINHNFDSERFTFRHLGWHVNGRDLEFRVVASCQRNCGYPGSG